MEDQQLLRTADTAVFEGQLMTVPPVRPSQSLSHDRHERQNRIGAPSRKHAKQNQLIFKARTLVSEARLIDEGSGPARNGRERRDGDRSGREGGGGVPEDNEPVDHGVADSPNNEGG